VTLNREAAIGPSTAFVIHNRFFCKICVNVGRLSDNIRLGYPSFILNLVNAYIHEFLHIALPNKTEQEVHDLEFEMVEKFLETKLPGRFKNLKASDYYKAT